MMRAKITNSWLTLVLSGCVALLSGTAQAQVDLNQFRPSERADDGFAISTAADQGHLRFGVQLYGDYADDPLVFAAPGGGDLQLVHQQLTGHLVLSLGLWERLVIFAGLPYHFMLEEDSDDAFGALTPFIPDGDGLGDAYVGARVRLYGTVEDIIQLAVQGTLNINTASIVDSSQLYRGGIDDSPYIGGHPELLITFNALKGRIRVSLNAGYRMRQNTVLSTLALGDELTYGVGGIFGILQGKHALNAIVEGYGRTGVSTSTGSSGFGNENESPVEVLAGLKYHHELGITAGVGGGIGVIEGYGAPDWRVFAMVGYTMPERDKDADGDGVADEVDGCPEQPEDLDGFQDDDGCPESDNDGDGIEDAKDGAPNDPEDLDGFEDEDGVPDPDNDGDGIEDAVDECPNEAGTAEEKGCPVRDRDGDGVPDGVDNCPDEPGSADNQGCKKKQLVEIQDDKLEILEKVYFRTGSSRIRARSFALLNNVAAVLNAHPEIKQVQVEGHTDAIGKDSYNMKLSQRRADSVVRYLVRKGKVDKTRLVAKGLGETSPVIPDAKTKVDHAANRRVEFKILESE